MSTTNAATTVLRLIDPSLLFRVPCATLRLNAREGNVGSQTRYVCAPVRGSIFARSRSARNVVTEMSTTWNAR
jgi:hypothetical protein